MYPPLQAVLFDLDGVLVHSPLDPSAIKKELFGDTSVFILEAIEALPEHERVEKYDILRRRELEAAAKATLDPAVHELFGWLESKSLKRGIITRNSREVVELIAKNHDVDFGAIVAREDAPPKPDPGAVHAACEILGVEAEASVMVGDFHFDMEAGRNAGCRTVFLETEKFGHLKPVADARIKSLSQLKGVLGNWNDFEKWRRPDFYKGYVLLLLLPLVIIAVLNFLVDPFDIYGVDLTEPFEHNSYELKLKFFRELPNPPEILVLGSSRLDTLDPELIKEITGKSCFNFALAAVEPGSMFAALKIVVEEYETELDTVIIGIDPSIFNENFRLNTMVQMVPAFSKYMRDHPYLDAIGLKTTFLFRPEQLRSSVMVIKREAGFVDRPLFREFREDGLVSYPIWDKAIADGTLNLDNFMNWKIPTWVAKYGIQNFEGPSEERLDYWYETLEICSSHGINVIIFITPNHPRMAEKITELGADAVYDDIKAIIEESVTRHDGIFFDFSDIESFGADPDLFYDGIHMQKENMELMTRALLAPETSEFTREVVR